MLLDISHRMCVDSDKYYHINTLNSEISRNIYDKKNTNTGLIYINI